ncbi:hypothetical protein QBC42DRAFT_248948 [Cladorrhinum samala]|uniref:Uncharacterized protein n=1 Tax=Cladorrhinum samala TaxID=585594 RepID=A0AAV9HYH0_9PEZI|nr:hypothetical protein QBC42DRAFT_248948 [Cladorrhinum samala]
MSPLPPHLITTAARSLHAIITSEPEPGPGTAALADQNELKPRYYFSSGSARSAEARKRNIIIALAVGIPLLVIGLAASLWKCRNYKRAQARQEKERAEGDAAMKALRGRADEIEEERRRMGLSGNNYSNGAGGYSYNVYSGGGGGGPGANGNSQVIPEPPPAYDSSVAGVRGQQGGNIVR